MRKLTDVFCREQASLRVLCKTRIVVPWRGDQKDEQRGLSLKICKRSEHCAGGKKIAVPRERPTMRGAVGAVNALWCEAPKSASGQMRPDRGDFDGSVFPQVGNNRFLRGAP